MALLSVVSQLNRDCVAQRSMFEFSVEIRSLSCFCGVSGLSVSTDTFHDAGEISFFSYSGASL